MYMDAVTLPTRDQLASDLFDLECSPCTLKEAAHRLLMLHAPGSKISAHTLKLRAEKLTVSRVREALFGTPVDTAVSSVFATETEAAAESIARGAVIDLVLGEVKRLRG